MLRIVIRASILASQFNVIESVLMQKFIEVDFYDILIIKQRRT